MNNDVLVLQQILDNNRLNAKYSDKGEMFEVFSISEVLKAYDLNDDQIDSGWVDGENDGGIDGFYIFVNGKLMSDYDDLSLPQKNVNFEVYMITCRNEKNFTQYPLLSIKQTVGDIFDFSKTSESLKDLYKDEILKIRDYFISVYKKTGLSCDIINFKIFHVCRGDSNNIAPNIISVEKQIIEYFNKLFFKADTQVKYIGSRELIQSSRNGNYEKLNLKFDESFSTSEQNYTLLVPLNSYYEFITDENDNLKMYLFDSNIRDYMGNNGVNDDIYNSLNNDRNIDFWLLNNGITIIVDGVKSIGKELIINSPQIVNGLQTTETLYRYFKAKSNENDSRRILVKVILATDENIRDKVIYATNNQTAIEKQALLATDEFQKDIESIMKEHGIFYNRRTRYYENMGQTIESIITPLQVASAYVCLVLKDPYYATRLKQTKIIDSEYYKKIFNRKNDINLWWKLSEISLKTDKVLNNIRKNTRLDRTMFNKRYKNIVMLLGLSKLMGTINFYSKEIVELDSNLYDEKFIKHIFADIEKHMLKNDLHMLKKKIHFRRIIESYCLSEKINDVDVVLDRKSIFAPSTHYNFVPESEIVKIIETVIENHENYKLPPTNSYERYKIHNLVNKYSNVTSESFGQDPERYVVIKYIV